MWLVSGVSGSWTASLPILNPLVQSSQTTLQLLLVRSLGLRQRGGQPAQDLRLHEGVGFGEGSGEDFLGVGVARAAGRRAAPT